MLVESGTLYVVATPIGNLGDISQRALQVLAGVTRICSEDTRNSKKLLTHFGIKNKLLALHDHNEQAKLEQLSEWLLEGESLALISDAGTPLISDPGYHLVQYLRQKGIPVVAIPGPCAIVAALSAAGLPTDRFIFEGFLPAKSHNRKQAFIEKTKQYCTQVYYESSHRIVSSIRDLIEVIEPNRMVVLSRELTKLYEDTFYGTSAELLDWLESDPNHQKGEFVLIVEGAKLKDNTDNLALEPILTLLMEEVSTKQAVKLASQITGIPKNTCYNLALTLK